MKLDKNDPLYYKEKLKQLMDEAIENGVGIDVRHIEDGARIYFANSNGFVGVNVVGNE